MNNFTAIPNADKTRWLYRGFIIEDRLPCNLHHRFGIPYVDPVTSTFKYTTAPFLELAKTLIDDLIVESALPDLTFLQDDHALKAGLSPNE